MINSHIILENKYAYCLHHPSLRILIILHTLIPYVVEDIKKGAEIYLRCEVVELCFFC